MEKVIYRSIREYFGDAIQFFGIGIMLGGASSEQYLFFVFLGIMFVIVGGIICSKWLGNILRYFYKREK